MPVRTYRWLLLSLAVVGLTADLVTKYQVFRWLYHGGQSEDRPPFQSWVQAERWRDGQQMYVYGGRYNLIPGWFGFTADFDPTTPPCDCAFQKLQTWSAPMMPRVNHGALFGMGGEHKGAANNIFAGVSVLAAIAILVWGMRRATAREKWLMAALGLILGGTIGNLYDRLVFNGVRDFLYFYAIEWPVFNVADCCLVVGAGLLLVQAVFAPMPKDDTPANESDAPLPDSPQS
jgi:signal peptidase II